MKTNHSSATAYLIAESAVYSSQNKIIQSLIDPQSIELCRHFAESRPAAKKIGYWAKRQSLFRPFFSALENVTIPGIQLHYLVRKRRLKEIALDALAANFKQIIVFGAGFDTLATRLHADFPAVNFVEIDHPATQNAKRQAIEARSHAGENLNFIALDLTEKSFAETLTNSEFYQKNQKTLFIAEGLLMYLKPRKVEDLFDFVNQSSADGSRFAFTLMERQRDGRIAFRNSSKLVDRWLAMNGEPFRWGLQPNELDDFLAQRNFSPLDLDDDETFRRRYLTSADLENLQLAAGESLCLAEAENKLSVNDIHSKLNKTTVSAIIKPRSIEEIQAAILTAKAENESISIAGGFHAMGGQQFLAGGIMLDVSEMNRVIKFEPENELIEVEGGIFWNKLVDYLVTTQIGEKNQVGIRQKQTGADNLSVGGAISANIHGRGLMMKPLIDDIESFRLVDANGEILNCSRTENAELFRLVIGGYGLFGIVAAVKLRLAKRQKLRRTVSVENLENLNALFNSRIDENFLYGDFQFAVNPNSADFLRKGVFSCYAPVADETCISENYELAPADWKNLLLLAHADKQKAFELYSSHYLKTDGQIYWSDTHQLSVYLNDYHREIDAWTNAVCPGSEMITELYVPRAELSNFMKKAGEDFVRDQTNLIYGTIRLIKRDEESFLAWAREDFACIVFNLHVEHDGGEKIERTKVAFRQLIDCALSFGGSYYLTYHRWATRQQILAAHPQMPEFLKLKKKYDPREIFQSDWYRHYKNLLE